MATGWPTGQETERLLSQWSPAPGTHVLDMVYRPRMTRLLQEVEAQGAVPIPGLSMFLAQAARQLTLFTGRRVSEGVLTRLLAGV
jgi:shikimate dehydrogenase